MTPSNEAGIVTAADHAYIDGLKMLVASLGLANCRMPVLCFDLGLTPQDIALAKEAAHAASVSLSFQTMSPVSPQVNGAPLKPFEAASWGKPFRISAAGFKRVIYIDADIVVLSNPVELLASGQAVFTPDTFAGLGVRNPKALYRLRPVPPGCPEGRLTLNSGIFMIDVERDATLLKTWQGFVREALGQPALRSIVTCHDQGALIWSLLSLGQDRRVVSSDTWNRPANAKTCDPASAFARTVYPRPEAGDYRPLIAAIRADHPGAKAVHWMGAPKLWDLWKKQDEEAKRLAQAAKEAEATAEATKRNAEEAEVAKSAAKKKLAEAKKPPTSTPTQVPNKAEPPTEVPTPATATAPVKEPEKPPTDPGQATAPI